ncbi:MAG: hypothetical protein CM1200mP20_03190 [Pseudomonadota bacterium]|nr:MAG: hypothetical protein CM1200mP20_03190 [Pseudomonadota bacterium]
MEIPNALSRPANRLETNWVAGLFCSRNCQLPATRLKTFCFATTFWGRGEQGVDAVRTGLKGVCAVIGHPWRVDGAVYNTASVIDEGVITARYYKRELPN